MTDEPLIGSDLVLLLLAAPTRNKTLTDAVPGITRLEKLLFLLGKETDLSTIVEDPLTFEPYDFGPYSKEVYEAVELLEAAGLLREELAYSGPGRRIDEAEQIIIGTDEIADGVERRFFLTDDGKGVARYLEDSAPADLVETMSSLKDRFGALPLRQLIRYVYSNYPESAKRSKIREEVMGE